MEKDLTNCDYSVADASFVGEYFRRNLKVEISNKQMDYLVDLVDAADASASAHCNDNSAEYVGERYAYLHVRADRPVPVRRGVAISASGRLFAALKASKTAPIRVRSAHPYPGVIATLRDEMTGEIGQFRLEIDGRNCVEIVGQA